MLLTATVFRALKETFHSGYIAALVNNGSEDVLKDNPDIGEIFGRVLYSSPELSNSRAYSGCHHNNGEVMQRK